jgi:hypothetical protein
MDKLLDEQLHTNFKLDANMMNYEIEEQHDANTMNNISNDEQVCIYNLPNHQSFV